MSRVELFDSLGDLSDSSAIAVIGTVVDQTRVRDIDDITEFTVSTILIDKMVKRNGPIKAGDTIQVRQLGGGEQVAPTPVLSTATTYLLYLTRSGLAAPLDAHFYVTGANAGVYESVVSNARGADASSEFVQLDPEPGEQLPSSLLVDDALRAAD